MKLVEVEGSTAILKIGYDSNNLFVQFVGGNWHKYLGVPETTFERLCVAPSKGGFVNKEIKPVYSVVRLTSQELETVSRQPLQQ